MGFDFSGTSKEILPNRLIRYWMDDDRIATIHFKEDDDSTRIIETFEAEGMNPIELQRGGWQAILDNFRNYAESIA
jgi:hypothetical protein